MASIKIPSIQQISNVLSIQSISNAASIQQISNVPSPIAPFSSQLQTTPNVTQSTSPTALEELSDVTVPADTSYDGDVLTYSAQNETWSPQPIPMARTVYISVSITGTMNPNEVLMQYALPEAVTIPAGGAAGTFAISSIAAQNNVTVIINKNNQQVGTIVWAPGSYSGTINLPSKLYLIAGDVLQLVAPEVPDNTLANTGVTFACVRGG